jgi:2-keto-4-pentenoate hydratase
LGQGAQRVGWKIGLGIGADVPVIGHLTSASRLESGGVYRAGDARELRADTELALTIGRRVRAGDDASTKHSAIDGVAVALELVDIARPPHSAEAIVAANVFHRGFAFGPEHRRLPAGALEAETCINGNVRACERSDHDLVATVLVVAGWLELVGECLEPGDRIIAGSITQVAVQPGERITAGIGGLGRVQLSVAG